MRKGFTLIELLVVMSIIMVLAAMLMLGINAARIAFKKAQCMTEIQSIMTALLTYENDLGILPPSGVDADNNGKISAPGTGVMKHAEAFPAGWTATEHPLVLYLTEDMELDDGRRTYAALYAKGRTSKVTDDSGDYVYLMDSYNNPLRYLADGRRPDRGESRVTKRGPIVWSVGLDGLPDPDNNQVDEEPKDGRVDDKKELVDDVCSWFD